MTNIQHFCLKNESMLLQAVPALRSDLVPYIVHTMQEKNAVYERHVQYAADGKRIFPVHFNQFLQQLDLFMSSHLTPEAYQKWVEVKSLTSHSAQKHSDHKKDLVKQTHLPRIEFCRFLLACILQTHGLDPVLKSSADGHEIPASPAAFIRLFTRGIRELETQGEGQESFRLVQSGKGKREAAIRDFFRPVCVGQYEVVESESPKGKGRIDLKVYDITYKTNHIVEYKGIWNFDRDFMVRQTTNYLTSADDFAYTCTISHQPLRKTKPCHRQSITHRRTGYISKSWYEYKVNNIEVYRSMHNVHGRPVTLFHFIITIPLKK